MLHTWTQWCKIVVQNFFEFSIFQMTFPFDGLNDIKFSYITWIYYFHPTSTYLSFRGIQSLSSVMITLPLIISGASPPLWVSLGRNMSHCFCFVAKYSININAFQSHIQIKNGGHTHVTLFQFCIVRLNESESLITQRFTNKQRDLNVPCHSDFGVFYYH